MLHMTLAFLRGLLAMTTTTKNDTLVTYVGDMHALVAHGLQAVERQVDNLAKVSHKDAEPAVMQCKQVLERQKSALASRLEALGGSASAPVKEAVSAIAGVAAGLINAVRPSETVKSLRDDATYFSGLGIAYLLLYTTAMGLGDKETSMLAEKGYQDAARLVMHFDRILPKITIEELREDKLDVSDVTEQVKKMVAAAWDRNQSSIT
jgi:ferritin-like metal-binding protein YciE